MKGHHFSSQGFFINCKADLKNRTECTKWKMAVPVVFVQY